ncbi:MAG: RluA family pseudouridine synthase [Firmicutes bacterium]|nr:RluA family pseudouridine synthase [Bacillota bacterium]
MLDHPYVLETIVEAHEEGMMIKDIVYGRLDLSRGLLRRMKRGGGVYLNGHRDFLSRRVKAGDCIQIEFFDEKTTMEPQNIPLTIVYEDDYLLIVNKEAGMAVHPTGAYQEGTLANALAHYWREIGLDTKVRLVHRIDKDTSGLIMVAKEPYTLQRLLKQLKTRQLKREYLALVEGQLPNSQGVLSMAIGRSMDHGVKRAVTEGGKEARTVYEVLSIRPRATLLRARLESGRTHQIRVHFAELGHPLLGDPLYSQAMPEIAGQALHAWRLEFIHPRTEQRHVITVPMPDEMLNLWKMYREET